MRPTFVCGLRALGVIWQHSHLSTKAQLYKIKGNLVKNKVCQNSDPRRSWCLKVLRHVSCMRRCWDTRTVKYCNIMYCSEGQSCNVVWRIMTMSLTSLFISMKLEQTLGWRDTVISQVSGAARVTLRQLTKWQLVQPGDRLVHAAACTVVSHRRTVCLRLTMISFSRDVRRVNTRSVSHLSDSLRVCMSVLVL